MSEFNVVVVEVGAIEKHPNADSLGVTRVWDYPVIVRLGDFAPGDLAVYVPIDSVVPDTADWAFLAGHRRIKAKKLRGVYSQGLLVQAPPGCAVGDDARERLGIEKYEAQDVRLSTFGEDERDPGCMPVYTDIEGLRRHPRVLRIGEGVVLTEKIHGANGRWCYRDGRLWAGSHKRIKREDAATIWWRVAHENGLAAKLASVPGIVLYGEVYGQVQDLKYGTGAGEARLVAFDAFDGAAGRYLDYYDFASLAASLGIATAPLLYRGGWTSDLASHAEGKTTMPGADHVREGFVVRPIRERWDHACGRVILKAVGEGYLLRKGG